MRMDTYRSIQSSVYDKLAYEKMSQSVSRNINKSALDNFTNNIIGQENKIFASDENMIDRGANDLQNNYQKRKSPQPLNRLSMNFE